MATAHLFEVVVQRECTGADLGVVFGEPLDRVICEAVHCGQPDIHVEVLGRVSVVGWVGRY